jgi:hypothetical protein
VKAFSTAIAIVILAGSTAWAQDIRIGPGGIRIDPDGRRGMEHRHHRRGGWDRGRGERCRVVVERRVNRFGERVTRRTRVCR